MDQKDKLPPSVKADDIKDKKDKKEDKARNIEVLLKLPPTTIVDPGVIEVLLQYYIDQLQATQFERFYAAHEGAWLALGKLEQTEERGKEWMQHHHAAKQAQNTLSTCENLEFLAKFKDANLAYRSLPAWTDPTPTRLKAAQQLWQIAIPYIRENPTDANILVTAVKSQRLWLLECALQTFDHPAQDIVRALHDLLVIQDKYELLKWTGRARKAYDMLVTALSRPADLGFRFC